MKITLNIDGPHSGDYSREVAEAVAEGIRVLNHASTGPASGLDYASDVDSILCNLQSAAYRLPQLLHQLGLASVAVRGGSAVRRPGPRRRASASRHARSPSDGIIYAGRLSTALREAGEATSHMQTLEAPDA